MEYKGQIKGFPKEVVEKMLDRQEDQGNKRDVSVFEESVGAGKKAGGFTWAETVEGVCFWKDTADGDFRPFFDMYLKEDKPKGSYNSTKEFFEEGFKKDAEKFADSKERRGCSHWTGLRDGYLAALEISSPEEEEVKNERKPIIEFTTVCKDLNKEYNRLTDEVWEVSLEDHGCNLEEGKTYRVTVEEVKQ